MFGGLRRGELLGLTFDSFNFDKSTVSITQSVSKTQTGIVIKKPKTRTSFRIVTLPSFVMELVKDLKQEQSEKAKMLGTYWKNDEGYLFTQENGSLMPQPLQLSHLKTFSPNTITTSKITKSCHQKKRKYKSCR